MKIVKIAKLAITVILASVVASCAKEQAQEETSEAPVSFTVQLNKADAEYAEVVVTHDGQKDATWFGFVTSDVESPVEDLIKAQLANVNAKSLHVGNAQTVAIRNLEEFKNYRYVAFGVNPDGERYGEPGNLAFSTSPIFDVKFTATAKEVLSHEASFSISHDGLEVLTYMAFVTEDTETDLKTLVAEHYKTLVTSDNKLNEGVELFSGNTGDFTFDSLIHETDYRFVIYGIYDNNGVVVYYGAPAQVEFSTPIDLSIVPFSAQISNVYTESASVAVTYDAKNEELSWYGFVTEDLTTPAASLIATAIAGITDEQIQTGKDKSIDISGLTAETDYRYIVTGVGEDGAFGVPADVKFSTLSEAYVNCVFSIAASDITPYAATLTITHTGEENFQYHGFFTEDLETPLADLPTPDNADSDLMTGIEKVVKVENLKPCTNYRYVVIGRYNGNEYGHRGEITFKTADNAVPMSYEDFIGEWKLNGQVFTVAQKEAGVSFTLIDLPGSSATRGGVSEVEALYDSERGLMFVMDQDLGQYDDPSTNNYGPLKDFYAGAKWRDNDTGYWPVYPFGSQDKSRVFEFVGTDDGQFVIRGAEGVDASVFGWVILTGEYTGRGNKYSGEIVFPATVTKFVKKAATYEDFLGQWSFGSSVITVDPKENGSTYSVTGLFGVDKLYGDVHEVIANYDPERHEFYIMEQKLGSFDTADVSAFGSNQYGICDDFFTGVFNYGSSTYCAYGYNTKSPARLFTALINGENVVEIIAGSCSYGPFVGFDYWWIIREGENAGKGNSYHAIQGGGFDYEPMPATMQRPGAGSSVSSVPVSRQAVLSRNAGLPSGSVPFTSIAK